MKNFILDKVDWFSQVPNSLIGIFFSIPAIVLLKVMDIDETTERSLELESEETDSFFEKNKIINLIVLNVLFIGFFI